MKKKHKHHHKKNKAEEDFSEDVVYDPIQGQYMYVVGYTDGGVPYGSYLSDEDAKILIGDDIVKDGLLKNEGEDYGRT